MKRRAKVTEYYGGAEGPLGFPMKDAVAKAVEELLAGLDTDCKSYLAKQPDGIGRLNRAATDIELRPDRREDVSLITTDAIDLDLEVMLPDGADWTYFEKNGQQTTWVHDYKLLPIGHALWFKRVKEAAGNGWKGATHYHEKPDWYDAIWFPDVVNYYVQKLGLRGKSIGFVPTAIRKPEADEIKARPELAEVDWIIAKWIALEWAACPVQCNPETVVISVAKARQAGYETPAVMLKAFGLSPEQVSNEPPAAVPPDEDPPEPRTEIAVVTRRQVELRINEKVAEIAGRIPAMISDRIDALKGRV